MPAHEDFLAECIYCGVDLGDVNAMFCQACRDVARLRMLRHGMWRPITTVAVGDIL